MGGRGFFGQGDHLRDTLPDAVMTVVERTSFGIPGVVGPGAGRFVITPGTCKEVLSREDAWY